SAAGAPAGFAKLILTVRVVRASDLSKCQSSTDCRTPLRSSSGPLRIAASETSPFALSFICTTTVPSILFASASAGYGTEDRCISDEPLIFTATPVASFTTCGAAISGKAPVTSQQAAATIVNAAPRRQIKRVLEIVDIR